MEQLLKDLVLVQSLQHIFVRTLAETLSVPEALKFFSFSMLSMEKDIYIIAFILSFHHKTLIHTSLVFFHQLSKLGAICQLPYLKQTLYNIISNLNQYL